MVNIRPFVLKEDVEIFVNDVAYSAVSYSVPFNKYMTLKAGTIVEVTGGSLSNYFIRLGERKSDLIVVDQKEAKKLGL